MVRNARENAAPLYQPYTKHDFVKSCFDASFDPTILNLNLSYTLFDLNSNPITFSCFLTQQKITVKVVKMSDSENEMDLDAPEQKSALFSSDTGSKGKRSAANLPVEAEDTLPWYTTFPSRVVGIC